MRPLPHRAFTDLLSAAGLTVRGNRFNCRCEGGSKLTGSFSEEKGVAYCHRCHISITARQLAREQGVTLPERIVGRTRIMKQRFREWLNATTRTMADRERRLARRATWARVALASFPEMESAWKTLAEWYHAQRTSEAFWESARDKIGRYWLYRSWRKHAC
jgi:hypothetical protein